MLVTLTSEAGVATKRTAQRACRFLQQSQDHDGAWRDFQLKPGRAESWTTAYIGLRLLRAHARWPDLNIDQCLRRALRFLSGSRQTGGWSYNQRRDPDCDTTAQVILLLHQAGARVALGDYAALARFQLGDGQFATYNDPGWSHGWARGHPEVTAVAMQAMGHILEPHHAILQRAEKSLREHLAGDHATSSYWWLSRNYLARELLMLGCAYRGAPKLFVHATHGAHDDSCFDRGLALEVEARCGREPRRLIAALEELLHLQLADGSWPVKPILRVTDPRATGLDDPLFEKSPVAVDDRRMFTTATILGALSACSFAIAGVRPCRSRSCFKGQRSIGTTHEFPCFGLDKPTYDALHSVLPEYFPRRASNIATVLLGTLNAFSLHNR